MFVPRVGWSYDQGSEEPGRCDSAHLLFQYKPRSGGARTSWTEAAIVPADPLKHATWRVRPVQDL